MNRLFYICFILAGFLIFNSCDSSISEYVPKNDDEKNVIKLLNSYRDARNNGDINKIQSLFHDNGTYLDLNGQKLTKKEIAKSDPEFWIRYGKIKLLSPEINIKDHKATVSLKNSIGVDYVPQVFTLIKENGNWIIMDVRTEQA